MNFFEKNLKHFEKCSVILSVAKNPHHFCHFEPFAKRRKIQRILRHALNLWILRQRLSMTQRVFGMTRQDKSV